MGSWGETGELGGVFWAYSVEALRGSPSESVVPHAEPRHGAEGHLHVHVVEAPRMLQDHRGHPLGWVPAHLNPADRSDAGHGLADLVAQRLR